MKSKKIAVISLALCSILGGATGCSTFTTKQVSANELSKTYTRTANESVSVTDDFKNSFADFSLDMFRETVKGSTGNKLLSPLSKRKRRQKKGLTTTFWYWVNILYQEDQIVVLTTLKTKIKRVFDIKGLIH